MGRASERPRPTGAPAIGVALASARGPAHASGPSARFADAFRDRIQEIVLDYHLRAEPNGRTRVAIVLAATGEGRRTAVSLRR